jgi:hypothetical protein
MHANKPELHTNNVCYAPITLIHIGKCGGSSVRSALTSAGVPFDCIHITPAIYEKGHRYVILIRNPIARFVSAFNWRRKLVCDDRTQQHRFPGEYELLQQYTTIEAFAMHITEFDSTKHYIHHINEDIHFYLGEFLKKCDPKEITAVLTTETLADDMKRVFDIITLPHEKENKTYDVLFSTDTYSKLKHYLHKDYACIEKLNQHGLLSPEQYKALSN